MPEVLYTIDILRLAASTGNWPRLSAPHGTAERRSPTCGSRVAVDVTLSDGVIDGIGLDIGACALGQASAAILARAAPGLDSSAVAAIRHQLAAHLSGETISVPDWPHMHHLTAARAYPARHPSILLAFDALLAAIEDANASPVRAHG